MVAKKKPATRKAVKKVKRVDNKKVIEKLTAKLNEQENDLRYAKTNQEEVVRHYQYELDQARKTSQSYAEKFEKLKKDNDYIQDQIISALRSIPREQGNDMEMHMYYDRISQAQRATQPGERVPQVEKPEVKRVTAEERAVALGKIEGILEGVRTYIEKDRYR